jgi:pimeloyl-ACP methyl ester carboxylesterase
MVTMTSMLTVASILTVTSKDGTKIAYDKLGQGPPIIIVNGALADRNAGHPLAGLLAPDFTVYCYDRRGRGNSSDTQPYSVKKEVEDLEAVIDAAGGSAYLYGSSSGAALALEAALQLGGKVKKLAMYEAPYDSSKAAIKPWNEYKVKLAELLAAGKRGEAAVFFMKFVGVPEGMIKELRNAPTWPSVEAMAPTIVYDNAVLGEDRRPPIERAASVTVPTLVMDGAESVKSMPFARATAEALAKAIPKARHHVLKGQMHVVKPDAMAPVLKKFFGS